MPALRLGYIAPDFEAQTTAGPIKFHEWIGDSWVLTFLSLCICLTRCRRPFFSLIQEILLLSAPPNLERSLVALRISRSAM